MSKKTGELLNRVATLVSTVADNEQRVYDAGRGNGGGGSSTTSLEFANALSNYGARKGYTRAFTYTNFDGITFPKDSICPTGAGEVFYQYRGTCIPEGISFKNVPEDATSDGTENIKPPSKMFHDSPSIITIRDVDLAVQKSYSYTYSKCTGLRTIEIIRSAKYTTFTGTFTGCKNLVSVRFEGQLGTSIEFGASPLDMDSLKNIISKLYDYSGTTTSPTLTLSFQNDHDLIADAGLEYSDRTTPLPGVTPNKYKFSETGEVVQVQGEGYTLLELIGLKGWKYDYIKYYP